MRRGVPARDRGSSGGLCPGHHGYVQFAESSSVWSHAVGFGQRTAILGLGESIGAGGLRVTDPAEPEESLMSGIGAAATSPKDGPLPRAGRGVSSQRRSLVAAPDAGAAARRELDGLAGHIEQGVLERSRLVLTELITNSVKHAGSGSDRQIELGLSVLAELLRIEVGDQGRGFEPMAAAPHHEQESGWGLWLVDQLTDRWGVDSGPPTYVWCELDLHREQGRRRPRPNGVHRRGQGRRFVHVVGAFLDEETGGVASYRRAQRVALGRVGRSATAPRPLEFDENGFPLPQRTPGFVERVARLLKPD
jgi:anti-sigma regulatory factor (Ser/Thr protein kinase)